MNALVYEGPGRKSLEERPGPGIAGPAHAAQDAPGGKVDARRLITRRFTLDRIADAYETFSHASETQALKVLISA